MAPSEVVVVVARFVASEVVARFVSSDVVANVLCFVVSLCFEAA